jgi:hypothetical protein
MTEFAEPDVEACPICGATGPCSLDDRGRPLIHTDAEVKQ